MPAANGQTPTGKIFGLGLSKTGTKSLADALTYLGIQTIHCPFDETTFAELRSGQYDLSILRHYQAATDTPVAPYYAQFDKVYPGSKFILTIREPTSWLRSVEHHWTSIPSWWEEDSYPRKFSDFLSAVVYGAIEFNRDRFLYAYHTHIRNVREYFRDRPDDLLVMDVCDGQGWQTLCPFLGVSIPSVPFPHRNATRFT